jgi:hypothetical protein
METTMNKETGTNTSQQNDGREVRRKIVKKLKPTIIALLALCWMSHFGSTSMSNAERRNRDEAIRDAMQYDMLTNGTAFGAYASSGANIVQRWANVSNQDEQKRQEEDHGRAVNFFFLVAFTGLGAFFLAAPKGKQMVETYIENGIK